MSHRDLCRISLVALLSTTLSIACQISVSAADKSKKEKAEDAAKDSKSAASKSAEAPEVTAASMPATAAAQAKLVPEKRDAIRRLMNVTRLPQVADKMYDMLLAQGQKSFELNLSRSIQEDSRYNDQQKNDLMQQVVASSGRMFSRYRELLPKEINLPDVLESISTQVYDKYFTAKELNDISDFYQTEAGKKALDVLPQVMQESAQMTGEVVTPKVKSIVSQIVMEERMRMESGMSNNAASGTSSQAKPDAGGDHKSDGQRTEPKK